MTDADSAVILGVRHESTPFAFSVAMWAKYGAALAEHAAFVDPKTKGAPVVNVFQATDYNALLTNRGVTVDTIIGRGTRIAVCQLATRAIATLAARKSGGTADEIFKELVANRLPNTRMVPAGVVALSRAQERGYTFSYVA